MSLINEFNSKEVLAFAGAKLLSDAVDVQHPNGTFAQNVRFEDGTPRTRNGYATAIYTTGLPISSVYNWLGGLGSILVFYHGGSGFIGIVDLSNYKLITNVTNNGSGAVRITSNSHGLTTGTAVYITGVTGVTAANGNFIITVNDSNTFDLDLSTFSGSYIDGGYAHTVVPVELEPGSGMVNVTAGSQLICAFFGSDMESVGPGIVVGYKSNAFYTEELFAPPLEYAPSSPTEPAAGSITVGLHRVGYIVESNTGFIGRLSPDSGDGTPSLTTFEPVEFVATGGKNASWVLNTTWPSWAKRVHVVMTAENDPNDWRFVPGAYKDLTPGGGAESITIAWDISDADLLANGDPANQHLLLVTQQTDGTPPFEPTSVVSIGDRMGYIARIPDAHGNMVSAFFVSNRNDYQFITANQHLIQLPEQKDIVTAFAFDNVCYIVGPHWTYMTVDNQEVPTRWPTPSLVDGAVGTLTPKGVWVGKEYAWVVSQSGLYLFKNGRYSDQPFSFNQESDWERINWSSADKIQVVDNPNTKTVSILVPLDGATTPGHIMNWGYEKGMSPALVDYSLDVVGGLGTITAMGLFQNDLPGMPGGAVKGLEQWIAYFGIYRYTSDLDNDFTDIGTNAIDSIYETAHFPGKRQQIGVQHHAGADVRISGSGSAALTVYSMDKAKSFTPPAITLAASPNREYLKRFKIFSEQATLRVRTNSAGSWFKLSSIRWYFKKWMGER
jgi:hypothetical protein